MSFWGGGEFHRFFNLCRRCPGVVPEMSRRCPGVVPEMSRRCPGDVPEMSRSVPEMSRRIPGCPPHVVCFRFRRFVFFFVFSLVLVQFFCFCVLCCFLGVLSVLALKKLVEFNSVCKIPFVLFAVQSVPSIFCFTVVLRCFTYVFIHSLGVMGT